jgi:hypothetical protein
LKFMMAATALIALSAAPALGGSGHMPVFNGSASGGGHVTTGARAGGQGSSTIGAYGNAGQLNGAATANGGAGGGASLKGAGGGKVQTGTSSVAGGFSIGNGSEENLTSGGA